MIKYDEILTVLVSTLGVMAVVMPFVIEFLKTMITEAKVISIFGVLERFCALVSAVAGAVVYVAINILVPELFKNVNIAQTIVIGIFFTGSCCMGNQVGYDKLCKWIIEKLKK